MDLFWVLVIVCTVCLTIESVSSWVFIRGSKRRHPVLWKHAGFPTLWGNGDLIRAWPVNRYVLRRRYSKLKDAAARQFADKLRLPMLVGYFSSWISIGVFLIYALVFEKAARG